MDNDIEFNNIVFAQSLFQQSLIMYDWLNILVRVALLVSVRLSLRSSLYVFLIQRILSGRCRDIRSKQQVS